ncbi:MAG: hypothetical protein WBA23_15965 [Tunicatimonas sp.]|uniref:hypothetical protein n=1 Tax=Tunicatimonas sp. TaxID=1940096 RepID=UPI003C74B857
MNIYGFEIKLNGEHLCRAGFEEVFSVLTCHVVSIRRERDNIEKLGLRVGGLNSETNQHMNWVKQDLQEGDKLSVEVISDNFDPPTSVRPR